LLVLNLLGNGDLLFGGWGDVRCADGVALLFPGIVAAGFGAVSLVAVQQRDAELCPEVVLRGFRAKPVFAKRVLERLDGRRRAEPTPLLFYTSFVRS
jgi:hypothetical protein